MKFELVQRGIIVASAHGEDVEALRREIMHYAMMYAQDGPCTVSGPLPDDDEESDE